MRAVRVAAGWLERQALFVAGLAAAGVVFVIQAPRQFNQDGWLGLVAGREVAERGMPSRETLTIWANGTQWVDQQWLSQLGFYGLREVGGMALLVIVHTVLAVGSLGLAIAAARDLRASEKHIVWVLPLAGLLFAVVAAEIRTQAFAYPLFVATLWLLVTDARLPRRRTLLCIPLLIVWANVHGSVVLGVALATLRGLLLLAGALRGGSTGRQRALWGRALLFCLVPAVCLIATPYGLDSIGYYRGTIFDAGFREVIAEWQPITFQWFLAVPFFVMAFAAVWLMGRGKARGRGFEQLALLLTIAASISTIRNIAWFALAAIMVLPAMVGAALGHSRQAPRRTALNLGLGAAAVVVMLVTAGAVATRPSQWFEQHYDRRALNTVVAAARQDRNLQIFAETHFADWLLWHAPELRGRIAYDTRFELLTSEQLSSLSRLATVTTPRFADPIQGYGLLVLDPGQQKKSADALLALPRVRPVLRGNGVIVARQRVCRGSVITKKSGTCF